MRVPMGRIGGILVLVLGLALCLWSSGEVQAAEVYKIGVLQPFSGPYAIYGEEAYAACQVAADQLNSAGFHQVVLCTGHMGDTVKRTIGNTNKGLDISYSQEEEPLGTGGALRLALALIRTDWILVMNGDSYVDADLSIYSAWHVRNGFSASILLIQVPDAGRFGSVQLDKGNRITCFQEKYADSGPGLINAGIYIIEKSLLEMIPLGKFYSLAERF